jgi:lipoprotein signal peptidase
VKKKENFKKYFGLFALAGITFLTHAWLSATLTVVPNKGVSFGVFPEASIIMSLVAILVCGFFLISEGGGGWGMILTGGIINFIDRIYFGFVRDYWRLPDVNLYNNLNDWMITFGVIFVLGGLWKKKSK